MSCAARKSFDTKYPAFAYARAGFFLNKNKSAPAEAGARDA
ncbi:hypothetical protein HMPREF7215_1433 [Pyramidobacter piscolens W5455]|uniref:Uncharacterized protein n=1 Tax=Pyramidobacter piscolens W5455 TaxID=352165 RepID=A0ABP2HWK1_9BACT|nr:hypothetical protein HMPREF7215_1433 [Pyramidobacter piscolens W5455]